MELESVERTLAATEAAYEEALRRERSAWGPSKRGTPKDPAEWASASDHLVVLSRRYQGVLSAAERVRRHVRRLESPEEVTLRATLATERMAK